MPSDVPVNDLIAACRAQYESEPPHEFGLDEHLVFDDEVFVMPLAGGATGLLCLRCEGLAVADIAWLEARPQGGGYGTRILLDLIAAANAHGVTLRAIPIGKEKRISEFYERHGFTVRRGDYWIRTPSAPDKPPTA